MGGKGKTAGKAAEGKSLESRLWDSANKLRGNLEAGEYKHVVLGLIFLKYAGDRFEEQRAKLIAAGRERYIDLPEFYTKDSVFFVPEEARWSKLMESAKQPDIILKVDSALASIERENSVLKGALPDNYYSRLNLDFSQFAALLDVVNGICASDDEQDLIGRIYEYFLGKFALSEGKMKGEYYTPKCVVKLIAEMIEPFRGKIYDPCCGSGGMFVQSKKFVEAHNGNSKDISIYGQEYTATTYKLAKMNLAIRGLSANLGVPANSFSNDQHPTLKADFIMANQPFNQKAWRAENELTDDYRWAFGVPPVGNANYGWIEHIISKMGQNAKAGFVLANGSLSTDQGGEGEIRRNIVEVGLVDCIAALPGQLFYTTQIPVSLWFLRRNKPNTDSILFIDARKLGEMEDRTHKVLSDADIARIADTYHAWSRSDGYADVPGFCRSAPLSEVAENGFVLTPSRYVGLSPEEEDSEPFEEKMQRLTSELSVLFERDAEAKAEICRQLERAGFKL